MTSRQEASSPQREDAEGDAACPTQGLTQVTCPPWQGSSYTDTNPLTPTLAEPETENLVTRGISTSSLKPAQPRGDLSKQGPKHGVQSGLEAAPPFPSSRDGLAAALLLLLDALPSTLSREASAAGLGAAQGLTLPGKFHS